jgi:hypothetical protein
MVVRKIHKALVWIKAVNPVLITCHNNNNNNNNNNHNHHRHNDNKIFLSFRLSLLIKQNNTPCCKSSSHNQSVHRNICWPLRIPLKCGQLTAQQC